MTYRWEFLVRQIMITDVVDLRVENRNDLLWAHRVHLKSQVSYRVIVRATSWGLKYRAKKWRFEQTENIECKVLKLLGQLAWILLYACVLSEARLRSAHGLKLQKYLRLDRRKVALVDLSAINTAASPIQGQCACVQIIKRQVMDVSQRYSSIQHSDSTLSERCRVKKRRLHKHMLLISHKTPSFGFIDCFGLAFYLIDQHSIFVDDRTKN